MSSYYLQDDDTSKFTLDDDSGFLILDDETFDPSRVSQLPVEALMLPDNAKARVSQVTVEVMHRVLYEDIYIAVID